MTRRRPISAFQQHKASATPSVESVNVRLTSGVLIVDTASVCPLTTRVKSSLPSTVGPPQTHAMAVVHVMLTLVNATVMARITLVMRANSPHVVLAWAPRKTNALAREHAILSLDCAHATPAPVVEAALKVRAARTVTTGSVKQTAMATMECVTGFRANVSVRHFRMPTIIMPGLAGSMARFALSLFARTDILLIGPDRWTNGAGQSARRVTC
jgi:hypothetical protein